MSKFQVGDVVRIKDNAVSFGWLRPGSVGTITSFEGEVAIFDRPGKTTSRYWLSEISKVIDVGDWVQVDNFCGDTSHPLVGEYGLVLDRRSNTYKIEWRQDSEAHLRLQSRTSWLNENEITPVRSAQAIPVIDSSDSDLRDAITSLPGLENASLVWNSDTDPAEFLYKYGAVLGDLLKYYKKKEAKLEKISEALEVLYDV